MIEGTVYGSEICRIDGCKCTYDGHFLGRHTIVYLVWITDSNDRVLGHIEGRLDGSAFASRTECWQHVDLKVRQAIRNGTYQRVDASGLSHLTKAPAYGRPDSG